MNPVTIVLVRPRDPNNIGACARAMGNFSQNNGLGQIDRRLFGRRRL